MQIDQILIQEIVKISSIKLNGEDKAIKIANVDY